MSVELAAMTEFLAQHEPFRHLPPEELAEAAGQMDITYVRRGAEIMSIGTDNSTLYIIRSGALDVLNAEGILVDRRDAGFSCGYSTLQGESKSKYTIVAVEDSLLYRLPQAEFSRLAQAYPEFERFFVFQSRATSAASRLVADEHADALMQPIAELELGAALTLEASASITATAQAMAEAGNSAAMIVEEGALVGIVTDADLRSRVLAKGLDPASPVREVMTRNPATLHGASMAMEALLLMNGRGFHHVPVVDGTQVRGVVTHTTLAQVLQDSPVFQAAQVERIATPEEGEGLLARTSELAVRSIDRGSSPREVSALMTLTADSLARRLCHLAEEELGPAPVPYSFAVLGSQGRHELGLASDQDNALVLDDAYDPQSHGEYFARLGSFVCAGLNTAGQVWCPGEMMAQTPQWRMTVSEWKRSFATWAGAPVPDALLHAQVFYDMRSVAGEAALTDDVMAQAVADGRGSRRLHAHLASLAARREPPLTLFRGFVVDRDGATAHTFDIKKGGLATIVQLARLYALSSGAQEVDTVARLKAAAGQAVSAQGAADLEAAWKFLRQLTFAHQARQRAEGRAADYHFNPRDLETLDRERLRDSFKIIKSHQAALSTKYPVRSI